LGERGEEAGYDRVLAIVPNSLMRCVFDSSTLGIVFSSWWYTDAKNVAFVVKTESIDGSYRGGVLKWRGIYLPTVAHELIHTFGFPDIYSEGNDLKIRKDWAFFDEYNGGIVYIGKNNSGFDIMDFAGKASRKDYWIQAFYYDIVDKLGGDDPDYALLISMIIYRNGTVITRPFSLLANRTIREPPKNAKGNFTLLFLNWKKKVVYKYPFNLSFYVHIFPKGSVPTEAIPFLFKVKWREDLAEVRLVDSHGKVWASVKRTHYKPIVSFVYPVNGMGIVPGRTYVIKWKGYDKDSEKLWYTLLMKKEGDNYWKVLAHRTTKTSFNLKLPKDYPLGKYILMLKVSDGFNNKIVTINIDVKKKLEEYSLIISSNIPVYIKGSGQYNEGDVVKLSAPKEVKMEGILGILGGKYVFQKWSGCISSKQRTITIVMTGEDKTKTVKAIYVKDMSKLINNVLIVIVVLVVILIVAKLALSKRK